MTLSLCDEASKQWEKQPFYQLNKTFINACYVNVMYILSIPYLTDWEFSWKSLFLFGTNKLHSDRVIKCIYFIFIHSILFNEKSIVLNWVDLNCNCIDYMWIVNDCYKFLPKESLPVFHHDFAVNKHNGLRLIFSLVQYFTV